jgi:hypothetical protein
MEQLQSCGSKRRRLNDEALPFQPCPGFENFGLSYRQDAGIWAVMNENQSSYPDCLTQVALQPICFGMVSTHGYSVYRASKSLLRLRSSDSQSLTVVYRYRTLVLDVTG